MSSLISLLCKRKLTITVISLNKEEKKKKCYQHSSHSWANLEIMLYASCNSNNVLLIRPFIFLSLIYNVQQLYLSFNGPPYQIYDQIIWQLHAISKLCLGFRAAEISSCKQKLSIYGIFRFAMKKWNTSVFYGTVELRILTGMCYRLYEHRINQDQ